MDWHIRRHMCLCEFVCMCVCGGRGGGRGGGGVRKSVCICICVCALGSISWVVRDDSKCHNAEASGNRIFYQWELPLKWVWLDCSCKPLDSDCSYCSLQKFCAKLQISEKTVNLFEWSYRKYLGWILIALKVDLEKYFTTSAVVFFFFINRH